MKKCPYCAEEIQDEAIVCRYCGKDLIKQEPPRGKQKLECYIIVEEVEKVATKVNLARTTIMRFKFSGRKFIVPNQCSKCSAKPAQHSILAHGKINTFMDNYYISVALPICTDCHNKNKLWSKKPAHYTSGCRSLVFTNTGFQAAFDQLNSEITTEAFYQSFREMIKNIG